MKIWVFSISRSYLLATTYCWRLIVSQSQISKHPISLWIEWFSVIFHVRSQKVPLSNHLYEFWWNNLVTNKRITLESPSLALTNSRSIASTWALTLSIICFSQSTGVICGSSGKVIFFAECTDVDMLYNLLDLNEFTEKLPSEVLDKIKFNAKQDSDRARPDSNRVTRFVLRGRSQKKLCDLHITTDSTIQ